MNPNQPQQLQLLGIPVYLRGDTAEFHIERHQAKLTKRPFDCGCDIYPQHIRTVKNSDPITSVDPAYEVIELSKGKRLINVHTGLQWTPVPQNFALLTERSSSVEKLNGGRVIQGIIDAGYEGELIVRVEADTADLDEVIAGIEECIDQKLAIAQMITLQFLYPGFQRTMDSGLIIPGGRGGAGFGSTDRLIQP